MRLARRIMDLVIALLLVLIVLIVKFATKAESLTVVAEVTRVAVEETEERVPIEQVGNIENEEVNIIPTVVEETFVEVTVLIEEMQETTAEETVEETTESLEETTIVVEEDRTLTTAEEWEILLHTGTLTARKGYIIDSPCGPNGNDGSETWYPDAPVEAVRMMEEKHGFSNLKMEVREDGVRILSGTMPNGETFKDLVVVAADTYHEYRNPNGIFNRGDLIQTSLGLGIVVDYCERADNEREQTGHIHIDIATIWD